MTREEAIEHGKEQLEIFGGEHIEFIKFALEALSEESKLDKIVAEIEKLPWVMKDITSEGVDYYIRQSEVLAIINKYRGDNE